MNPPRFEHKHNDFDMNQSGYQVIENTGEFNLVKDVEQKAKTRESRFEHAAPRDNSKNESSSSDDSGNMAQ